MKHFIAVVLLCLLSVTIARAQQASAPPPTPVPTADDPATAADLDRSFEVMHVRDTMKTAAGISAHTVAKLITDQANTDHSLPPDFEAMMNQLLDRLISEMPIEDMIDSMRPAYMKHFTHSDMEAVIAFYSSPVGQKILAQLPAVMQEGMQAATPVMQKYQAQVQQEVQDQIAKMQKQAQQESTIKN